MRHLTSEQGGHRCLPRYQGGTLCIDHRAVSSPPLTANGRTVLSIFLGSFPAIIIPGVTLAEGCEFFPPTVIYDDHESSSPRTDLAGVRQKSSESLRRAYGCLTLNLKYPAEFGIKKRVDAPRTHRGETPVTAPHNVPSKSRAGFS